MKMRTKLAALLGAGALILALGGVAIAASVDPILHDGNIGLPGQGGENTDEADCDADDALKLGDGNDEGTTANGVTVTQTYNSETKETSFEAEGGLVTIAYIKGGDAYNEYNYTGETDGGVAADSGLVAPDNESGGPAGLSHTVYCTVAFERTDEPDTEPPSDMAPSTEGTSGPGDSAWLLVVALGVILASVVVLTPARKKAR